jgi:6-phosphogluconolactonase
MGRAARAAATALISVYASAIHEMSNPINVFFFETAEQLAMAAAARFVAHASTAIRNQGRFTVALAGGQTPKLTYETLARDFKETVDWTNLHVFFGDERCVPPDDPQSNYRLANDALLSRVGIPDINVHRIHGEDDPVESALAYECELRALFDGDEWPRFDLVLLGMGSDGHTASLFPGTAALAEKNRWVVANWIEKLGQFRITLTAPAINNANHAWFLVTGAEKAATFNAVTDGPTNPELLPAQLINPHHGSVSWFVSFSS